jgi:hypothetical protein
MNAGQRIEVYNYRGNQYTGFNHGFFPLVHLYGTRLWIPEDEIKLLGYLRITTLKPKQ